ncbi:MAG: hypothetical protein PVI71_11210 [Desulfobacterales bacterium]|jgi:hypothetical protein
MILPKKHFTTSFLALTFCLAAFYSFAGAQSFSNLKLDAERIPWTQLSFHAKNFLVEVSTNLQLITVSSDKVEEALLATPKGVPIKPAKPSVRQMNIATTIDPIFRPPVKINYQVWFNPQDAAVLGRTRLRRGEDDLTKIYRFTEQGVFRQKKAPKDPKEAALEPEKWTNIHHSFYPYDLADLGCPQVSGRLLLLYIISAADISKRDSSRSVCVFGKKQVHHVRLRTEGLHALKVNHLVKGLQTEVQKKETVEALKIAITANPMGPDPEDPEKFSFLGLHKDIAIYIDPSSRLPIQVNGTVPTVGKVSLILRQVRLRQLAD